MNKRQIEDEEIAAALIQSRTKAEAAEKLNISARQLYARLKSYTLQALIQSLRADALRSQMQTLAEAQTEAAAVVIEIMRSEEATTHDRLKAAALILDAGRAARKELAELDAAAADRLQTCEADESTRSMLDAIGGIFNAG